MRYCIVFIIIFVAFGFGQDCTPMLHGIDDVVYINSLGQNLEWVATNTYVVNSTPYNVLHNDALYDCPNNAYLPATTTNVTFAPNNTSPDISIDNPTGSINSGFAPYNEDDTYLLTYTIALTYTSGSTPVTISELHNVLITVVPASNIITPLSSPLPTPIIATAKNVVNTTGKTLTYINIPDTNLKNQLLTSQVCCRNEANTTYIVVDANGDSEIDTDEALNVGVISIPNAGITDITGLEYFQNLKILNLPLNQIASVNTSVLSTLIERLALYQNPIPSLDTSYFPNLYFVAIFDSQVSTLDFGSNPNFVSLLTRNCPNLTSINIKNGNNQSFTSSVEVTDCWSNCPNLTNVCVDASEMTAVQNYLTNCGHNMSVVNVNSNCALSSNEYALGSGITIAPNPSSGVFTIAFSEVTSATIGVYNVLGQQVMSLDCARDDKNVIIDLTGYPSGVYLMVIESEQGIVKERVIKK